MNRTSVLVVALIFLLVVNAYFAISLLSTDECTVQVIEGREVRLDDENLKQYYSDGFFYHEDAVYESPERDPVFLINGTRVLKLQQIVGGWEYELVSLAFLRQFSNLRPVGQISSFMNYQYYPSQGEIRTADGTVVVDYMQEYDPPYWTWAWNTLMFSKNDRVALFVIQPDGTFTSEFISLDRLADES